MSRPKMIRSKLDHDENEKSKLENLTLKIWIFHPQEPIRLVWDVLVGVIMVYIIISTPIKLCFEINLSLYAPWSLVDLLVNVVFLIDIILSFNTGYFETTKLITSRRKIALNYIRGWFFLDLITSIPFEWILDAFETKSEGFSKVALLLKIARIARLLKLLRLAKLVSMISKLENESTNWTKVIRVTKFVAIVFFTAHITGCLFMGIANLYRVHNKSYDNDFGFNPHSWVVRNLASPTWKLPSPDQYLRALYWAFTTLCTVGYGDITPLLEYEILLTICVQIAGSSIFGFIIGNMASLIAKDDDMQLLIKEKMKAVRYYITYRKFPEDIAKRIQKHYELSWSQNQVSKEAELLSEMPQALRAECALFVHRDIIKRVPLLTVLGEDVVPSLVTRLRPLLVFRGDVVVKQDLFGSEMIFISEGQLKCQLFYKRTPLKIDVIEISRLYSGEYFSEYAVIMDQARHPASVIAENNCDLHCLSRADFLEFGGEYPLIVAQLITICKKRFLQLNKSVISKRQLHMMKLNVLNFEKQDAVSRGEDPDELTISPCLIVETLEDLGAMRSSMTTLTERISLRRQFYKAAKLKRIMAKKPENQSHMIRYKTAHFKTLHGLNSSKNITGKKHLKLNKDAWAKRGHVKVAVSKPPSPLKKIAIRKPPSPSKLLSAKVADAAEHYLSQHKDSVLIQSLECTKCLVQQGGAIHKGDKQEEGDSTETQSSKFLPIQSGPGPILSDQVYKFTAGSSRSLLSQKGVSFIDELERPKLPWWVLIKVMSWKNRAQLEVAMSQIESVEKRHQEKFNLRATNIHEDSSTVQACGHSTAEPVCSKPFHPTVLGPTALQILEAEKQMRNSLVHFSQRLTEAKDDLHDLHVAVDDIKSSIRETRNEIKRELHISQENLNKDLQHATQRMRMELQNTAAVIARLFEYYNTNGDDHDSPIKKNVRGKSSVILNQISKNAQAHHEFFVEKMVTKTTTSGEISPLTTENSDDEKKYEEGNNVLTKGGVEKNSSSGEFLLPKEAL